MPLIVRQRTLVQPIERLLGAESVTVAAVDTPVRVLGGECVDKARCDVDLLGAKLRVGDGAAERVRIRINKSIEPS
jgi:hypothetical protein